MKKKLTGENIFFALNVFNTAKKCIFSNKYRVDTKIRKNKRCKLVRGVLCKQLYTFFFLGSYVSYLPNIIVSVIFFHDFLCVHPVYFFIKTGVFSLAAVLTTFKILLASEISWSDFFDDYKQY